MTTPDVSVVVPCFNHGIYLERLVNSVLAARDGEVKVQIVLVDDGSTDDSRTIATHLADRFSEIDLVFKENGGLSSARNAGIDRCKGRFVHFVDADDYVLPGAYSAWLDAFARSPDLDLIYGSFVVRDEVSGNTWENSYPDAESVLKTLISYSPFPPHAVMLRFNAIERNGYFDEEISPCADWDYWARAYGRGLSFGQIEKPLVVYDRRPGSMSRSFRAMVRTALVVRQRTKLLERDRSSDFLTLADRCSLVEFVFRLSSYDFIVAQLNSGNFLPARFIVELVRAEPLVVVALVQFARSHKRLIARAALARAKALLGLGPSCTGAG